MATTTLGIYLHIPFCRGKCPYCDFFSVTTASPLFAAYPDLLLKQLERAVNDGWSGPVTSVYFGGGTPSLLQTDDVARLLSAFDKRFGLADDVEITLEANPGTIDLAKLQGLHSAGVNRLSLGIQSLDDSSLHRLGRRHDRRANLSSVKAARQAGFDNLSLDLMFALPGQTLPQLESELAGYLDLNVEHLSCYGLTAEPGTPFSQSVQAGEIKLPDDDFYAEAFLLIDQQLTTAGYQHYEIANYGRPGRLCRHNQRYWKRADCLGLGAGAHSFCSHGWGSRWAVASDLQGYADDLKCGRPPSRCLETFDRLAALSETLYLGLRTAAGVAESELRARFGASLHQAFPAADARHAPWLRQRGDTWSMNVSGWLLYDRLIQEFLQADSG